MTDDERVYDAVYAVNAWGENKVMAAARAADLMKESKTYGVWLMKLNGFGDPHVEVDLDDQACSRCGEPIGYAGDGEWLRLADRGVNCNGVFGHEPVDR